MFNYEQNKLYVSRDLSIFKTLEATMLHFQAVKLMKQSTTIPYSFYIEGNYMRSLDSKNDLLEQLTCKFNASNENYFIDDLLRLIDFKYNNILNTASTSTEKIVFTNFPIIEESIQSLYTPIIVYPLISESNKSLMNKFDNLNMALI